MSLSGSSWRQSSQVFHERAQEYDSWFDQSLLFAIERATVQALTLPFEEPGLEIGVGPGRFAEKLGSSFGIDPANAPLHLAKERGINVCQAVGEKLPFADASFGRVSLFFTLCFVQDPEVLLQECYRVLTPTGHLLLGFVPAGSSWGQALQAKKDKGHPFYEHATFYTVEECDTLISEAGFTVADSRSGLYQQPDAVVELESPRTGIDPAAGFIVLALQKTM